MSKAQEDPVLCSVDKRGVAEVIVNRPHVNNAYDGTLVDGLLAALDRLGSLAALRAVVIKGKGRHFQAGADLNWLDRVRHSSPDENLRVSARTAEVVKRLEEVPVPTIALVHGACFGGGVGIIAACDFVVAAENAVFSIAEVRWGLTPSIILHQLNDAMGVRQVRRYALTGERFDAAEARRIGLVHEVAAADSLDQAAEKAVTEFLLNGPEAIAVTKRLAIACARKVDEGSFDGLVQAHAARRQSDEAGEGLSSFAAKKPPKWAV
jgi:methylglutaconyl-CoA hydratase